MNPRWIFKIRRGIFMYAESQKFSRFFFALFSHTANTRNGGNDEDRGGADREKRRLDL